MKEFPARVHVLLAQRSPLGLVIRRGPARKVATVLWHRHSDEFEMGQWMSGRIYERRCDLSSDGKHLIYFAMNGKWESETRGAWTAISKAPYLKALALFPKGDCWQGGGLWTGPNTYWLNGDCGHATLKDCRQFRRDAHFNPCAHFGGECAGVYYPRLLRDGWQHIDRNESGQFNKIEVFEKPAGHGWRLRKKAHAELDRPPGKGCYWDEHELVHSRSGKLLEFPDWEWAEIDENRLVWATCGKLFAGQLQDGGLQEETELYDFNQMTFEPLEAPY